ncbi:MAG: ABC transporter substrate-binding protein [Spirochaetaceae bacterium]|jgi:putative aldouronate transport system substrate-binding protein|nr:ABC transporter substrate-binding protein [Spirochaetaceae bacterium]
MKKMQCAALLGVCLMFLGGCEKESGTDGGVPTLIWWQIGNTQPDFASDLKVISDYTQEKIGIRVEIKQAGWADSGQKFTTMINTGEYYDILFTDLGSYNRYVSLGAFLDITDMLSAHAPKLLEPEVIDPVLWQGVKIKEQIYAVPTYKDSAVTGYYFWDHAYVEKYGIDITQTSWTYLDQAFSAIKAGESPRFYPLSIARVSNLFIFSIFDSIGAELPAIGVDMQDANHRVVNTLEDPRIREKLRYLSKWYEAGIINPDANTTDSEPRTRLFFMAQAWPSVAYSYAFTAGIEQYDPVQFFGPFYSTGSIQGSMNAINANSKYKTEALKFLELVNTDTKLRDMLAYGIEGKHFEYVNGGSAVRKNPQREWSLVNYQQGAYFIITPEDTVPPGYWDEVRKLNAEAESSVMLGFLLDPESIQNELANCRTVYGKYATDLVTGASDPDKVLPQVIAELKSVGFDKVMAESQRQVDAFFAAK